MKQKRKVKSLLPQKNFVNGRFLTILLVILSLVLCIGSVSLLTHSVRAADNEPETYTLKISVLYAKSGKLIENIDDNPYIRTGFKSGDKYEEPGENINNYDCSPKYVYVIMSGSESEIEFNVYCTPKEGHDRNEDGIADDDQWRTLTILYEYNNGEFATGAYVNGRMLSGDRYEVGSPLIQHYVASSGLVTGVMNSVDNTLQVYYYPDANDNGIPDKDEKNVTFMCSYKTITGNMEQIVISGGYISGNNYTIFSPNIPNYRPEPESFNIYITGDVTLYVNYKPNDDWNNNDIADQDENLQPINDFEFDSPVDNVQEVLYGMQFIDPLDVQKIVNNLYISGSNFYITPNPVILSGNTVDAGLYSHVLGGERNEVYSKNITLIAGGDNIINDGNENASILGGDGNQVRNGDGIPAILVGGENNIMKTGHNGNALIGGKGNSIEGGSNDFILGGEDNVIDLYSENVILGGKKIHIEDKNNIFVYSNFNYYLYPQSQNAFYLNMLSGVGINTGSSGIKGLSVGGAVSFGDVNISLPCVGGNLGVKGTYSGCLVGCTEKGKDNGGKWEMLDLGDKCAHLCTGNYILCGETVVEDERDNTLAECTTGVVNTDNAHLCMSGLLESYRGVVFESSLIDSDDNCPNGENICVYQCDEGFHLTGDKATGKIGCYSNCDLPWGGTIRHNETVVAYNTGNVACSNDIYVFPRDTEMINTGRRLMTPLYTIVDITKNGIKYEKRAKNGKSYESCGNYDHKKELICNNGVLELMDKNGKPIQNSSGLAQNYNLSSCNLYNYRCNTGETGYNLTQHDIENQKNDKPKNGGSWEVADRLTLQGERGQYEVCIDFDADSPTLNGESCSKKTYHYKFKKCQDHYKQDSDGVCRGQCSLTKKGGGLDRHDHGTTFTGFKDSFVPCPGSCTGVQLTCDDGSWKLNGGTVTGYYNYCGRAGNSCDGFDLKENELESGGVYSPCESYEDKTCTMTVKYKFDGCTGSYHQVPGTTDCAKNRQPMTCETTGKEKPPYSHYTNTTSGAYEIVWSGGKNDYVDEPENPCDWECDSGYRKNAEGTGCVKISDECGDTLSQKCKDPYAVVTGYSESDSGYNWDCGDRHCVLCKTGYYTGGTAENPVCEPEIFNACDNSHPYGCITGTNADTDNPDGNNITFTWNCPGLPNDDAHGGMGCSFSCPAGSSWNFDHKQCEANVCAQLPEDEGDVKWCSGATGQATTNNMNPTYDSKCEEPVACKYRCSQGFWRYNGVCFHGDNICGDSLYSCNGSYPVNTGSDESHYYRNCEDQDGSILATCGLEKERGVCGKAVEGVCENIVVSSVGGCHSSINCYDIPANEAIPECCLNIVRNSADCSSYTGETVCNNKKSWVPNFHRNMYVCSWNNYLTGHGACYCDGVECGDEYCNEDCLDYGIYYDELLGIDLTYPTPITYWYIDNPFSKYFNVIDTYTVYDTLLVSNVPLQCTNNWGQVDTGSITIVKPYKQSSALFGFSSINELNEKLREGSFYSYKYNSGWVDHDHTYTGNCEEDAEACICGYKGGDKTVLYIYDYYNYGGFVRDCDPEHAKVEVEYGNTCSINNMAGPWMSTCTINYNQN